MSGPRAEEVDVTQLAVKAAVLERRFPLSDFSRLRGLVVAPDTDDAREVRARFGFARQQGQPVALIEVEASLPLTCQRCLQPMDWPVKSATRLVFVASAGATETGIEGHDAYAMHAGHVALSEVVEEELLLALPLVAAHAAAADCGTLVSPASAAVPEAAPVPKDSQRPFAGLKELLRGK